MVTLEQIVDKIVAGTKLTRDEVMAKIKEVRDDAGGMISQIGAASIVAYKLGVKFDFDQFEAGLDPPTGSPPMPDTGTDPADSTRTGTDPMKAACVPPLPQNHTRIAETIYDVLTDLSPVWDGVIPIGEARKAAEARGILGHTFDAFIKEEIKHGELYRPPLGNVIHFRPSRSTRTENGGIRMGVSDIYSRLLNVQLVNEKNLWDKPLLIVGTDVQEFDEGDRKILLILENVAQKLALNVTNADILAEAWGDDFTKWDKHSLKLVKREVKFKGRKTDSIGVVAV